MIPTLHLFIQTLFHIFRQAFSHAAINSHVCSHIYITDIGV